MAVRRESGRTTEKPFRERPWLRTKRPRSRTSEAGPAMDSRSSTKNLAGKFRPAASAAARQSRDSRWRRPVYEKPEIFSQEKISGFLSIPIF